MADPPANIDFQFVNSTLSAPTVSQDLATRALIRKQAMKKASAARRRDGNYGKHNLRQYPVFLVDQDNDGMTAEEWERRRQQGFPVRAKESTSPTESSIVAKMKDARPNTGKIERDGTERQRWQPRLESVPPPLSPKRGYESVRMRTDFDLLDLSTLATLHIGRAVRAALSQNPYHLIHQLHSHKRWSYLTFLPQRYGQSKCLSDATDCVIARARQIISPGENWEAAVISCYVRALDSLQKALDCPRQRFQPDVLAATEVLALYELLDPSGETAWVRHTAGAAKLVQLRGPKNYNTEFEKALFLAQTVPIMTESLLNGKRCFLEQKLWQNVMHSVIEEGLSSSIADRSDIVVGLLTFKSCIPGFFVDVTNLICIDPNPDIQVIEETASRIRALRQNFLDWYSRYQNVLSQCKELYPGSSEYDSHCKVFANYLSCNMISSRLLAAISGKERAEVEKSVQALAGRMFLLEEEVKIASAQTIMFMAQTLAVAKATMVTAEDWLVKDDVDDGLHGVRSENGLIERWKFEKWAKAFGRKMPESEWELALDDGEPGRYNE